MIDFKRRYFRVEEITGVENCIIEFDGTIWHIFRESPETIVHGKPQRKVLFAATSLSDCEQWVREHFPMEETLSHGSVA